MDDLELHEAGSGLSQGGRRGRFCEKGAKRGKETTTFQWHVM
jgi:hypothetical protein